MTSSHGNGPPRYSGPPSYSAVPEDDGFSNVDLNNNGSTLRLLTSHEEYRASVQASPSQEQSNVAAQTSPAPSNVSHTPARGSINTHSKEALGGESAQETMDELIETTAAYLQKTETPSAKRKDN